MSLTDEYWTTEEYDLKGTRMTRRLAQTHETLDKDVGLGFITYNTNMKVPCLKYDMVMKACINNFGYNTREYLES